MAARSAAVAAVATGELVLREPGDLDVRGRHRLRGAVGARTAEQRKIAQRMSENLWGATMVLARAPTPDRTWARTGQGDRAADGSWHIEGVKRFHHRRRARPGRQHHPPGARPAEGHGPGHQGLSLFIVPKVHFDWTPASSASATACFVTNVEHKMGLKVSTPARSPSARPAGQGWPVGRLHNGISMMLNICAMPLCTLPTSQPWPAGRRRR